MEQKQRKPCGCLKGKEADERIAKWRKVLSDVSNDIEQLSL